MTSRQDLVRRAVLRLECAGMCRDRVGTVRVLRCDEHDLFRHGFRLLLDSTPDPRVCRDVASPADLDDVPGTPADAALRCRLSEYSTTSIVERYNR